MKLLFPEDVRFQAERMSATYPERYAHLDFTQTRVLYVMSKRAIERAIMSYVCHFHGIQWAYVDSMLFKSRPAGCPVCNGTRRFYPPPYCELRLVPASVLPSLVMSEDQDDDDLGLDTYFYERFP